MTSSSSPLAFDHLVVMLRDELEARSAAFEAAGYRLGPPGYHNLGSMNRLIALNSTYIELLGWPQGSEPLRKEIANQPLGLDALVFRSHDAHADQARLHHAGFDVQPVSHLERPVEISGSSRIARFNTVRFNSQPIDGLRVYFCQHLTPELVWNEDLTEHANGARFIHSIELSAADAASTAAMLAKLVNGQVAEESGRYDVRLENTLISITTSPDNAGARINRARLLHADGNLHDFDYTLGAGR